MKLTAISALLAPSVHAAVQYSSLDCGVGCFYLYEGEACVLGNGQYLQNVFNGNTDNTASWMGDVAEWDGTVNGAREWCVNNVGSCDVMEVYSWFAAMANPAIAYWTFPTIDAAYGVDSSVYTMKSTPSPDGYKRAQCYIKQGDP